MATCFMPAAQAHESHSSQADTHTSSPARDVTETTAQYPLTIQHAFGTTVIENKPQRIATVAWANHEVPLALGVVPVGFPRQGFGDDDGDGMMPWVKTRLEALGGDASVLREDGRTPDIEALAASKPDVILAAYSGLSEDDYARLSEIAPVVARPGPRWSSSWRDMIRLDSAGMGMAAEGEALIERLEAQVAENVASHPEIQGKSAIILRYIDPEDPTRIAFYNDNDTRLRFLAELGLTSPSFVSASASDGKIGGRVPPQQLAELADVDILLTYGGQALIERLNQHLADNDLPTFSNDRVILLENDPMGTAANPTPLSMPAVLDAYIAELSRAAEAAKD